MTGALTSTPSPKAISGATGPKTKILASTFSGIGVNVGVQPLNLSLLGLSKSTLATGLSWIGMFVPNDSILSAVTFLNSARTEAFGVDLIVRTGLLLSGGITLELGSPTVRGGKFC